MEVQLPQWALTFIGVVGAIGGYELIKYLLNIKAKRRTEKALAAKQEAEAKQADAAADKAESEVYQVSSAAMLAQIKTMNEAYREMESLSDKQTKLLTKMREENNQVQNDLIEEKRMTLRLQNRLNEASEALELARRQIEMLKAVLSNHKIEY